MAKDPKAVNLTALYTELNQQGQNGEYDKALKTTNKILQTQLDDDRAFHCKIVCLIQLTKFQDVLRHLSQNPNMSRDLAFEKAYSLYRLNRTDESLEVLQTVTEPDQRVKELLAQVLYRKEEYGESFAIYKDVIKNTQDDYEDERSTNLSAVMAALQMWDAQDIDDLGLGEDSYELCYNAACGYLGHEKYAEALEKLKAAEDQCRKLYTDDPEVTEEDVEAELGDIRVQMGYVYQQIGKNDEAMKYYNMVIRSRPTDIALAAVASNNIITLNKDQNVFESQKRIRALQTDGLHLKLTRLQRQALNLNQCLFYLLQNKNDMCRKSLQTLRKEEPDSELPALVEAALYSKEKQYAKAIECLKAESEKSESLQLQLATAQLSLSYGQVYQACSQLKALGNDSYRLGVVSTLVALYLSQEDLDSASEVLTDTVKWYQDNKPDSPDILLLMRANASFQLRRGNPQGATVMLEELRKENPSDMKTLAQLISAYSKFDSQKAQLVSRELPLPTDLSKKVDVDALESSANTLGPRYIKKTTKTEMSPSALSPKRSGDEELLQKKKKKKKKVKLPKEYDPNSNPDPERWLPLRERTYYRGKRKKKGAIGKGTQGAVSAATAAEFDKSGSAAGGATQSPSAEKSDGALSPKPGSSGAAPGGPRQQKPPAGKQKKKKKGSKW